MERRMTDDRATRAMQEVGRIHTFFPILTKLGNRWAATRPFEGRTFAVNLHLTTLTAALVRELRLGGGRWLVSAANPNTTDPGTVALLRQEELEVFTGGDMTNPHERILMEKPEFLVDVGFELGERAVKTKNQSIMGAIEITRSGIIRLRNQRTPQFPVINLNGGKLKEAIENRHGVGEAIWHAVSRLTGIHLSGRRVAVLGYGAVGRGLCAYARAAGMSVEVVEPDPFRRLVAHYDGYPTPPLASAVQRAQFIVTATGVPNALPAKYIAEAKDGLILLNAGHGGDEFRVSAIERRAKRKDNVAPDVVNYAMPKGKQITVLGGGHPLNIVLNSGSPEPVLLHYALLGLTLEWLISRHEKLDAGEHLVKEDLEQQAAALALSALNGSNDSP